MNCVAEAPPSRTPIPAILAVLVGSLPLMDLEVFQLAGKSIVVPYVLVAVLGIAVVFHRGLIRAYLSEDVAFPLLAAWLAVMFCSGAVAFLRTQDSGILASNVFQFANLAYMGVHYLVIAAAVRACSEREVISIRDVFVLTACAGAVYSIYQVGAVIFGWPYDEWLRTSNLYYKANTLNWHGGGSWIALPRAYGAGPEPTFWAGYLAIGLAFALGRWSAEIRLRHVAEVGLITVGLLLTFSRAALPPVLAVLVVWLISRVSIPRWLLPATVVAVFTATIIPAFLDDRWLGLLPDHSSIERISAQVTGLHMLADFPLIGIGPGSIAALVDRYLFVVEGHGNVGFSRLYSFTLTVLVTSGVIGGVLFAGYLIEVGRREVRVLKGAASPNMRMLALSAILTYVCVIVYWLGSPAYNMSFLWFSLAFGSALGTHSVRSQQSAWSASA